MAVAKSNNNAPLGSFYTVVLCFFLVSAAVCGVWAAAQLYYFLQWRTDGSFVQKRRPVLSAFVAALCWISMVLRVVLLVSAMYPETALHLMINNKFIFTVASPLIIFTAWILFTRLWLCYFDFKHRLQLRDMEWTAQLKLTLVPWTVRYGKTLGSFHRLVFALTVLYFFIDGILLCLAAAVSSEKALQSFRVAMAILMVLTFVVALNIFLKVSKFDDYWDIRNELRLIIFFSMFVMLATSIGSWFLETGSKAIHCLHFSTALFFSVVNTYVSMPWVLHRKAQAATGGAQQSRHFWGKGGVLMDCLRSVPLRCCKFEANPYNAAQTRLRLGSLVSSATSQRTIFGRDHKRLKLLDVLSVKHGFKAFCYHLCNEYSLESLLFIIQLLQIKEMLLSKRILNEAQIGRRIELPKYVLKIHKHKSLRHVTDSTTIGGSSGSRTGQSVPKAPTEKIISSAVEAGLKPGTSFFTGDTPNTTPVDTTPVDTTPVDASPVDATPVTSTTTTASGDKLTPVDASSVHSSPLGQKLTPVDATPVSGKLTPLGTTRTPVEVTPVGVTPVDAKLTPVDTLTVGFTPVVGGGGGTPVLGRITPRSDGCDGNNVKFVELQLLPSITPETGEPLPLAAVTPQPSSSDESQSQESANLVFVALTSDEDFDEDDKDTVEEEEDFAEDDKEEKVFEEGTPPPSPRFPPKRRGLALMIGNTSHSLSSEHLSLPGKPSEEEFAESVKFTRTTSYKDLVRSKRAMSPSASARIGTQLSIYGKDRTAVEDCVDALLYLYSNYVMDSSITAINVSWQCRKLIGEAVDRLAEEMDEIQEESRSGKATKRMKALVIEVLPAFDVALSEVFSLLARDSFDRFCGTDEFRQMLLTAEFEDLRKLNE